MTTSKELLDFYRGNFHSANQTALDHLNTQAQYSYLNPAMKTWRPGEAGDKKIRFLPVALPTPGEGVSWGYRVCVYFGILPDRSSVASPTLFDQDARDPFGAVIDKLIRRFPEAKSVIYSHRSWRWATYVLDRKIPGDPHVWLLPKRVFEVLFSTAKETAENGLPSFDDLLAGFDFNFKLVKLGSDIKNTSYEGMTFSRASTPVVNSDDEIAKLIAWIMEHPIQNQFVRLPEEVVDSLAERFENLLISEIESGKKDLSDQSKALDHMENKLAKKMSGFQEITPARENTWNVGFGDEKMALKAAPVLPSAPVSDVSIDSSEIIDFAKRSDINEIIAKYGIKTEGRTSLEIVEDCIKHSLSEESGNVLHA